MNIKNIINEAKSYTLENNDALFLNGAGEIILGKDGCQPSNTQTLAVGPDEDRDWSEIETAVREWADALEIEIED